MRRLLAIAGLPAIAGLLALAGCGSTRAPSVQASPLHDTTDSVGPYQVTAVTTGTDVTSVKVVFRAEQATQSAARPLKEIAKNRWQGGIPGYPAGTTVHWFVEAEDTDGNVGYDPPEAASGDATCLDTLGPGAKTPPGGAAYCFSVLH